VEENRGWCLPAARWFFDDVLFSRIAFTTVALCGGVPIVLKYRKRPGGKYDGARGACGEHAGASPGGKRRERAPALPESKPSCHTDSKAQLLRCERRSPSFH